MAEMEAETSDFLKNMNTPIDPTNMPSRKELLEMLDASELSDEMKDNLRTMLVGDVPQVFGGYASGTLLAILFVFLIFSILLFFGYKLYKSLKEKEKKKEEKKKLKLMKKKK